MLCSVYIRSVARATLPRGVHSRLRRCFGDMILLHLFRRLKRDPLILSRDPKIVDWAYYGWASGWAASPDLLRRIIHEASRAQGNILECGSGLSTLLLAFQQQNRPGFHVALEHDPEYAKRIEKWLRRLGLASDQLALTEIRSYDSDYDWYEIDGYVRQYTYSLVVCDGPPGGTKGGRYGLLPQMMPYLNRPCLILLDDAARASERGVLDRWESEFCASVSLINCARPYAEVVLE